MCPQRSRGELPPRQGDLAAQQRQPDDGQRLPELARGPQGFAARTDCWRARVDARPKLRLRRIEEICRKEGRGLSPTRITLHDLIDARHVTAGKWRRRQGWCDLCSTSVRRDDVDTDRFGEWRQRDGLAHLDDGGSRAAAWYEPIQQMLDEHREAGLQR